MADATPVEMKYLGRKTIENIDLNGPEYSLGDKIEFIRFLHMNNLLSLGEVVYSMREAVIRTAKNDFKFVTRRNGMPDYPDQLPHPEFLAFAISEGIFSKREIGKIPFDHGKNAKEFCKIYGISNLTEHLAHRILNYQFECKDRRVIRWF